MKHTPFTDKHIALGAKMADFAGYNMPISYPGGIKEEHLTVRKNAGVFDVSHMGEFLIKGPGALDLIQKVTSNNAAKLTPGKAQYSFLPNEQGGIIDDLIVYCLEENNLYLLVVNAANIEKDWNWISKQNTAGATMENISDRTALLAIQGPNALAYMQELTEVNLADLKYYTFQSGTFAGVPDVLISATGYTGSGGIEIYFEDKGNDAAQIWSEIFRVGTPKGLKPIGLGARDTLRLEKGFCLYGNDIDDNTSPYEAGLGWITKLKKGDFIAKDILAAQKEAGVQRKLVGLEMIDKGIPRQHYLLKDADGNDIGHITSGTMSPSLDKAIALAYISQSLAQTDTEVFVAVRNKMLRAKVVALPFVK